MTSVSLLATSLAASGQPAQGTRLSAATIKAGLRTEAVEEGGFIERVVNLSKEGVLPGDMVDSTFQWARKKPKHRFQYFKRALTVRAAAIGVTL